jgi:hypothetical protein
MNINKARFVMYRNLPRAIDRRTGEVCLTTLAEETAHDLGHSEWLDDETHPIWDLAIEVSEDAA